MKYDACTICKKVYTYSGNSTRTSTVRHTILLCIQSYASTISNIIKSYENHINFKFGNIGLCLWIYDTDYGIELCFQVIIISSLFLNMYLNFTILILTHICSISHKFECIIVSRKRSMLLNTVCIIYLLHTTTSTIYKFQYCILKIPRSFYTVEIKLH